MMKALSCWLHLLYCTRMSSVFLRHEPLATVRPRMGNNTVRLPPKVWRMSCPTEPGNGCLWTRGTTEIIASCICNIGSLIESANAQYWQTVNSVRKYRCLGLFEDNGRVDDHFLLANYSSGKISYCQVYMFVIYIYCVIKWPLVLWWFRSQTVQKICVQTAQQLMRLLVFETRDPFFCSLLHPHHFDQVKTSVSVHPYLPQPVVCNRNSQRVGLMRK